MSGPTLRSPRSPSNRFSREGFIPLSNMNTEPKDVTVDIPLTPVMSRGQTGARKGDSPLRLNKQSTTLSRDQEKPEKSSRFHLGGMRKRRNTDATNADASVDGEGDKVNSLGRLYSKILNFSIVTRYLVYILPVSALLAIPIIIGATVAQDAQLGGVRIIWIFTWIEAVWLSLWVSKLLAKTLPWIFQFICGVVSSGTRKYASLIHALEIPLSLVGWAVTCLSTFIPLMTRNPTQLALKQKDKAAGDIKPWESRLQAVLAAAVFASLIFFAEKLLIQVISINYHKKQFSQKIKTSKRNIYLLSVLYDASTALFPAYCPEFAEEDYVINNSIVLGTSRKDTHKRSGSGTPLRLIQNVGRVGDKLTSAFGNVASEITGKQVFNPTSAHNIVVEALEKKGSSEALAKRLWMSFVVEGSESLHLDDLIEVLGPERRQEAEEAFVVLDKDNNGDISLEEMVLTVVEAGRQRRDIANSMHDVDQAINVLDQLLQVIAFVIVVFVFVAFLNKSFTTTLATAGTALLSMSFVFAVTAQEVLGSCIFLFVKHPYDVGDRVDIDTAQLTVEHISLLFSVFKRVDNHKAVQIPNQLLNQKWIENITRSKAMREVVLMYINFDTTLDDIQALRNEMLAFVQENSRDFQPDIDIEITGIAEMNKLELKVEIRHKSNWSNETLRAARRSKFMCALVLALRKVPIYGPGAGDAALGDLFKPSYTVAISDAEAAANREKFVKEKEEKRLFPSKKPDPEDDVKSPSRWDSTKKSKGILKNGNETGQSTGNSEQTAVAGLNARSGIEDEARENWGEGRDAVPGIGGRASSDARRSGETRRSNDLEEVRGLLHRESTRGRRKRDSLTASQTGFEQQTTPLSQYPIASPSFSLAPLTPEQRDTASPTIPAEYQRYLQSQAYNPNQPPRQSPQGPIQPGSQQPGRRQ